MLYATYHNNKANTIAKLAVHRALYFDSQTDISDAHLDEAHYISKIASVRAWGNSTDTASDQVVLSPMSGVKGNYFYPARSARMADGNQHPLAYTSVQTPKAVAERYFCVYDSTVGNGSAWAAGQPVFTGNNGPSYDTSTNYYWPTPCMLVFPTGLRSSTSVDTYSSKSGNQYARNVDSFWHTYSGYDAGYTNASLDLSAYKETSPQGYSYISPTGTPMQSIPIPLVTANHIGFVRPVGMSYSYNGLNQFSAQISPALTNGVSGYTRDSADAFNMRVAVTGKSDTPDVTLTSCMMMFKCNGQGYMVRATVGQDMTQAAPTPTGSVATLGLNFTNPFGSKTLYQV